MATSVRTSDAARHMLLVICCSSHAARHTLLLMLLTSAASDAVGAQVAGLLITAGRAFSGGVLQCLLYLILRRPAFLYSLCAYSFSMYATVQLLTWPQQVRSALHMRIERKHAYIHM